MERSSSWLRLATSPQWGTDEAPPAPRARSLGLGSPTRCARDFHRGVPPVSSYFSSDTALAMTRPSRMKPEADSSAMSPFARVERGIVSVGLNAIELVSDR